MNHYVLPDLFYGYGDLEPHLSGKIMELHHDKHHRAYVEGANRAMEQLLEEREAQNFSQVAWLERLVAFNVSGHVLHSIFWQNLSPDGGGRPSGELLTGIERDFGSFEVFKKQIVSVAGTIMGSGWAALVWDPILRRLATLQIHDHQSEVIQASTPLLVIDVWEHAYYLQYQTDKAKYFAALWNLWHWDDVAQRYANAQSLNLSLQDVAQIPPSVGRRSIELQQ
jgi:Fe-Mn family superoxide dismutase